MAQRCQFPESAMRRIIDEVFDDMDAVIDQVSSRIPKDFPKIIADSIFDNMRKIKGRCLKE